MSTPRTGVLAVRVLISGDLGDYRALHRHGLEEAPQAFAQTIAQDAARSDAEIVAFLDSGEVWGVFSDGRLVGKLVMNAPPYAAFAHTRWLHAVYCHPDARGTGAGAALIQGAIAQARADHVQCVMLWVHSENPKARAFYEKQGFRETGRIPGGIRVGERTVDDVLMFMPLG